MESICTYICINNICKLHLHARVCMWFVKWCHPDMCFFACDVKCWQTNMMCVCMVGCHLFNVFGWVVTDAVVDDDGRWMAVLPSCDYLSILTSQRFGCLSLIMISRQFLLLACVFGINLPGPSYRITYACMCMFVVRDMHNVKRYLVLWCGFEVCFGLIVCNFSLHWPNKYLASCQTHAFRVWSLHELPLRNAYRCTISFAVALYLKTWLPSVFLPWFLGFDL